MAGKNPSDAELDAEVMEEARRTVQERRRKKVYQAAPWWVCSRCGFQNHPRQTHPGHTACEQCGKERDDQDVTREAPNA